MKISKLCFRLSKISSFSKTITLRRKILSIYVSALIHICIYSILAQLIRHGLNIGQQLKYYTCWEGEKVFLYNSEGDKWITDYEKTESIKPQYFYIILSGEVKVLLVDRELKRTKDIALIEAFKILKDHNSKVIDRIALLQNDPNIQELVPIIDDLLNESLDQANNEDWFIDEGKA